MPTCKPLSCEFNHVATVASPFCARSLVNCTRSNCITVRQYCHAHAALNYYIRGVANSLDQPYCFDCCCSHTGCSIEPTYPSPIGPGVTSPSNRSVGPEWVTAISAVVYTVFTIILALVAVFQDDIRRWRASARLKVSIHMRRPWCAKVPDEYTLSTGGPELYASVYYLRLAIENVGTVAAENVEVFVNEIRRFEANTNQYHSTPFDSMNLVWAYIHTTHQDLPVNIQKYCDFAHVHDPIMRNYFPKEYPKDYHTPLETILCLNTWYQPKSRGYLLPAGTYLAWLTIGGTNCKRIQCYLKITLTGKWIDEEDLMASQVVNVEELDSKLAQTIMNSRPHLSSGQN
jgi:hypothetical protein